MTLLEACTEEIGEREHLGNVKRKWCCGGVCQGTGWGRDDANTHDHG